MIIHFVVGIAISQKLWSRCWTRSFWVSFLLLTSAARGRHPSEIGSKIRYLIYLERDSCRSSSLHGHPRDLILHRSLLLPQGRV